MAELVFFTGPMDCGKSTLALQMDYTQSSHGRVGQLFTRFDRAGEAVITSRIGLSRAATEVDDDFGFMAHVVNHLTSGGRLDYIICDETQFFVPAQIDELARIVDELGIDVFAFGILSDFRTEMFPGSKRLVELADRVEMLQVQPLCWCGERATHNARTVNGVMVVEGSQVVVGDVQGSGDENSVRYEVLCRKHHRQQLTKKRSAQQLQPDQLPFQETDDDTD
ncbi:thymidine kinase [Luteococcus sp. Sow4_B9]|uniref:thymidine kinase n=1 Tax=Luteococcus sp. Sow4_B9 TaxID=3438792 RepID=UPI003F9BF7DC